MNFNILTTHVMVSVTQLWLAGQRELFLSISKIAPYLEDVEAAHLNALALNQATNAEAAVQALTDELTQTDNRHDDAIRCVYETLNAGTHYCQIQPIPNTEEAARLQKLLEQLLPHRLMHVRLSYRDQAGFAETMIANLDDATKAQLMAIQVMGGNLLEVVLLWGELGRRIGELDSKRTILMVSTPVVASEREIRGAWMAVVKQVLSGLNLVKGRDEAVTMLREPLFKVIADAEARAVRRDATKKNAKPVETGATEAPAEKSSEPAQPSSNTPPVAETSGTQIS